MSTNSFTQELIKNLRNGERCLNGNKIYKLYKDCPVSELKNFLRAYARSLNGPEKLPEGYRDHHRYHYWFYNGYKEEPTDENIANTDEPFKGYDQSMPMRFHPAQKIQQVLGTRKREARLHQIWLKLYAAKLVNRWRRPNTNMELFRYIDTLSKLFNMPLDDADIPNGKYKQIVQQQNNRWYGYRQLAQFKRKGSCKPAEWVDESFLLNKDNSDLDENQKKVYDAFSSRNDRKNAVRLYSELVGSCMPESDSKHSVLDTGIKHEAAIYDKYGILLEVLKDSKMKDAVYTLIFATMMTTELGKRNSFILDPQKHGSLNPWLKYYLDNYGDKIERYDVIFSIVPCEKYFNLMTEKQKRFQLKVWSNAMNAMAWYLERQFELGVTLCIENNMLVPRSGRSDVDSGGYNSVTGAWNNSLRHLRWLQPDIYDVCYKCMKLLAGDQMMWASWEKSHGGANANHLDENDRQMKIFQTLTAAGYRPWSTLFEPERADEIRSAIIKACYTYNIPPEKWLGKSQMRTTAKTEAQGDQVCGVSVGPGVATLITGSGIFGSTPSTMT